MGGAQNVSDVHNRSARQQFVVQCQVHRIRSLRYVGFITIYDEMPARRLGIWKINQIFGTLYT